MLELDDLLNMEVRKRAHTCPILCFIIASKETEKVFEDTVTGEPSVTVVLGSQIEYPMRVFLWACPADFYKVNFIRFIYFLFTELS